MHLLEGSSLEGRALTRAGAIDLHNNVITLGLPPVAAVIEADGPTTICEGDSVTISGNFDGVFSNGETTTSITVTTGGDYFVVNTTLCGSDTSNHIIITVAPPPTCGITGDTSICEGETVELCATGGSTFLWSTGEITACIMVSNAADFSVTITDDNGCTNSCSVTTTIFPLPSCTISGELTLCAGETTELCAPAGGGSYLWSTGETGQCITVSAEGSYSITVTGANGCSSICSETVVVNPLPDCTITGILAICDGQSTELCGPPGLFSYLWNTGESVDCIMLFVLKQFPLVPRRRVILQEIWRSALENLQLYALHPEPILISGVPVKQPHVLQSVLEAFTPSLSQMQPVAAVPVMKQSLSIRYLIVPSQVTCLSAKGSQPNCALRMEDLHSYGALVRLPIAST